MKCVCHSAGLMLIVLATATAFAQPRVGKITGKSDASCSINLGTEDGLAPGDHLSVYMGAARDRQVAFLTVMVARERSCSCSASAQVQPGWIVVPMKAGRAGAEVAALRQIDARQRSIEAKQERKYEQRAGSDFPLAGGFDARLTQSEEEVLIQRAKDFSRPAPTELTAEDRRQAALLDMQKSQQTLAVTAAPGGGRDRSNDPLENFVGFLHRGWNALPAESREKAKVALARGWADMVEGFKYTLTHPPRMVGEIHREISAPCEECGGFWEPARAKCKTCRGTGIRTKKVTEPIMTQDQGSAQQGPPRIIGEIHDQITAPCDACERTFGPRRQNCNVCKGTGLMPKKTTGVIISR